MWNLKINDTNDLYLLKRKRLTDLENELMVAGGSTGEGVVGEFGMDIYTPLCSKWITNRVCIAYGALLNVTRQPGWEESLGENRYMYLYG